MKEFRVLFISPDGEDAAEVSRMLDAARIRCEHAASCQEARVRMGRRSYDAVLTAGSLGDGDWKDVLDFTVDRGDTAPVIVTDRRADDRFWAEVLNLGCYDMLAQPFETSEVVRILTLACSRGAVQPAESSKRPLKICSAAAV